MAMRKHIRQIIKGMPTRDGAGVELVRVIGQPALGMLDPFLLLDTFRSHDPKDYIAGFPSHPHRGFETVTYLLNGRMRHKDNAGHEGVIEAGGIQWMTAGKGIIHSEMPEQENGLLEGFQLWVNLPADHKMDPPRYQEFSAEHIPVEERPGSLIRVITGTTSQGTQGPVAQPLTHPLYLDITLESEQSFTEPVPLENNSFVYGIEGMTHIFKDPQNHQSVTKDQLALLSEGDELHVTAGHSGSRFLLISGKPLNEPVVRGGPFVMNSQAEVRQAIEDYQSGRF
ncbi:MAG: pirin family protein [Gammaproteobacteria bacterium]|nr:pirin family protein [Gammaproteobacteria bacterium]